MAAAKSLAGDAFNGITRSTSAGLVAYFRVAALKGPLGASSPATGVPLECRDPSNADEKNCTYGRLNAPTWHHQYLLLS